MEELLGLLLRGGRRCDLINNFYLVNSDGFATHVHPNAIQGAIFQVNRYRGRFQGLINTATPAALEIV